MKTTAGLKRGCKSTQEAAMNSSKLVKFKLRDKCDAPRWKRKERLITLAALPYRYRGTHAVSKMEAMHFWNKLFVPVYLYTPRTKYYGLLVKWRRKCNLHNGFNECLHNVSNRSCDILTSNTEFTDWNKRELNKKRTLYHCETLTLHGEDLLVVGFPDTLYTSYQCNYQAVRIIYASFLFKPKSFIANSESRADS